MPQTATIRVSGLRELNRAFASASKEVRRDMRKIEREIAEPVRAAAEGLAVSRISGLARSSQPRWAGMRIGVTRTLVYVAPKQRGRGSRRNRALSRPNMADLLMDRAMEPALQQNEAKLDAAVGHALDRMAASWERKP